MAPRRLVEIAGLSSQMDGFALPKLVRSYTLVRPLHGFGLCKLMSDIIGLIIIGCNTNDDLACTGREVFPNIAAHWWNMR